MLGIKAGLYLRAMPLDSTSIKMLSLVLMAVPVMAQESFTALPRPGLAENTTLNPVFKLPPQRQNQTYSNRTLYHWSVAAVVAANAADVASSWRKQEANPLLAGSTDRFGTSSVALKSGLVVTSLLLQHFVLKHKPELAKRWAWTNLVTAGALGGVAAHNMSIH